MPPTPPSAGRIPDFFIVGHAKSGTTALYEMLKAHPQIFMPERKEPFYFANVRPYPRRRGRRGWTTLDQTGSHFETFDEYRSLFTPARADQLVGEASTHYLWSNVAPRRIAEVQPEGRVIAIFREPVSFLRSLHLQLCQNRHETEADFRKAIALEPQRRHGRRLPRHSDWPACLLYSDRVRYVAQLQRFHDAFARGNVLTLIYDDFRSNNENTVREVLRFLDIDGMAPIHPLHANPSVEVRSTRLDRLSYALLRGDGRLRRTSRRTLKMLLPKKRHQHLSGRILDARERLVYRTPPPIDESYIGALRQRFKPEVEAFSEYIGRDLITLWGYDRI